MISADTTRHVLRQSKDAAVAFAVLARREQVTAPNRREVAYQERHANQAEHLATVLRTVEQSRKC